MDRSLPAPEATARVCRLERVTPRALAVTTALCVTLLTGCARPKLGEGWSFEVFPRLPGADPRRLGDSGEIAPDPSAPICPPSGVDEGGWTVRTPEVPTKLLDRVTLRLPPAYVPRPSGFGPGETPPPSDHILGSWNVPRSPPERPLPLDRELALWIGSRDAFPTVGASLGTRQLAFDECRATAADRTLSLVRFTLATPDVGEMRYVGAVWPVGPGVWLTGLGSGPDDAAQAEIRAALESVRFAPASR